jgi:hypothetical protein
VARSPPVGRLRAGQCGASAASHSGSKPLGPFKRVPSVLATPWRREEGSSRPRIAALSRVVRPASVGRYRAGQLALHVASTVRGCGAGHLALGPGIVPQTAGAQVCHLRASSLPGPRQCALFSAAAPFRAPMHPDLPPQPCLRVRASLPLHPRPRRRRRRPARTWRAPLRIHDRRLARHPQRTRTWAPQVPHHRRGVGRRGKTGSCVRFPCIGKMSYLLYSRTWDTCGTWNTWELRYLGDLGHWWSLGCLGEIRS